MATTVGRLRIIPQTKLFVIDRYQYTFSIRIYHLLGNYRAGGERFRQLYGCRENLLDLDQRPTEIAP